MTARKGTLGKIYDKAKEVASSALAGAAQSAVDGATGSKKARSSRASTTGQKKTKPSSAQTRTRSSSGGTIKKTGGTGAKATRKSAKKTTAPKGRSAKGK